MEFQWYPGHMTKAVRAMKEDIKLVDLIMELVDARAPLSSRNPDIDKMGQGKARLILLNKADLADETKTKSWESWFRGNGFFVCPLDSRNRGSMKAVSAAVREASSKKRERDKKRGILNRPVRAMVVGIPNVGKSTFINSFAGRAAAKTGNKPGVTRGNQWIRLNKEVELLDTPGILWPKFEDQSVGLKLALLGSIKDDILNREELSLELLSMLKAEYFVPAEERYGISRHMSSLEALEQIADVRGCLKKGGEPDTQKAADLLLDDFRSGRLGRITLETPKPAEKREL